MMKFVFEGKNKKRAARREIDKLAKQKGNGKHVDLKRKGKEMKEKYQNAY